MAGAPVSLSKKLGVRAGQTVVLLGAPERFRVDQGSDDDGVTVVRQQPSIARWAARIREAPVDCVMLFVDRLADLEDRIGPVTERLHPDGQIWVVWRSRRSADVTEEVVRRIGMAAGMVDTRACQVDGVWSGMRLVIRAANRDAVAYRLGPPRRTRRATRTPAPSAGASAGSAMRRARAQRTR